MTETQDEHELKALLQEGYLAPPPRDALVASLRAEFRRRFRSVREMAPPVPSPVAPIAKTSPANLHARIAVVAAAVVVALVCWLSGRHQGDVEVAAAPKELASTLPQLRQVYPQMIQTPHQTLPRTACPLLSSSAASA